MQSPQVYAAVAHGSLGFDPTQLEESHAQSPHDPLDGPYASPLSQTVDGVRRLADAGVGAVVLYSLFEEQLRREAAENARLVDAFRRSLCSLRSRHERKLLGRLKSSLQGYQDANDEDFQQLRSMRTNEVQRFDASRR